MKRRRFVMLGCLLIIATLIVGCSSELIKGNELPYIKQKLELGMTKDEVKKLLGRAYLNMEYTADGGEVWRYDFTSSQLFISWSKENSIKDIAYYYTENGELKEYRVSQ